MSLIKRFGFITYEAIFVPESANTRVTTRYEPGRRNEHDDKAAEASGHDSWQCKHDDRRRSRTTRKRRLRWWRRTVCLQFVTHHPPPTAAGIEL